MPHGDDHHADERRSQDRTPPGGPRDDTPTGERRDDAPPGGPRDEAAARSPAGLPRRSAKGVLRRTLAEFKKDELTDRAAALTYYGVLAIFPALLALVSVLGLIGGSAIQPLVENLGSLAPGPVRDLLVSMLNQLQSNQGAAGVTLVIGIILALWSASGYVAAFMRSANVVYDIGEGRPVWKTLPVRFGVTITVVVILALAAIGVGDTGLTVWNYAKWPVILLLIALVVTVLYWAAPNVKRGFSWVAPGGVLAVLIWLVASALFGVYVSNFSNYDKTYGSLAGIIIFLVWLWLSNIAILLGLEFNAELERERAIRAGHPPGDEPYAEPRDTRKL